MGIMSAMFIREACWAVSTICDENVYITPRRAAGSLESLMCATMK